jgi:flagellar biogenesis protein FliO
VSSYSGYLIETLGTLLGVSAIAFFVLWGGRRLGVGRATGPLELCGHLPLDGRRAIYLLKVGEQVFLIGVGEGGFTKLGEMPAGDLPVPATKGGASFAEALGRAVFREPRRDRSAQIPSRSK